jgi:hypothetical protein
VRRATPRVQCVTRVKRSPTISRSPPKTQARRAVFPATPRANARRRTQDGQVRAPGQTGSAEAHGRVRQEQADGFGVAHGRAARRRAGPRRRTCPQMSTSRPGRERDGAREHRAGRTFRERLPGTLRGQRIPANACEQRTPLRSHERDMVRRWHYLLCLPIAWLTDRVFAGYRAGRSGLS